MAKVSLGPLGVNVAHPCVMQDRTPPERTEIKGWSPDAARRNRRFLQSVDPDALTGEPFALTLTTRDLPPDAATWAAMIVALRKWLGRRGMIRYHWVVEWQERGAPHLHAMIFMDGRSMAEAVEPDIGDDWERGLEREARFKATRGPLPKGAGFCGGVRTMFARSLAQHWCDAIAAPYGAGTKGQHVVQVDNLAGWVSYLSKHAIRGAEHYQRARGVLPEGWQKSGRLWAKGGAWTTREEAMEVDPGTARRLHRLIRRWQRAQAIDRLRAGQRHGNPGQVRGGRGQLRHLARSGSGQARPEALRLALQLLRRAQAQGRTGPALELLEQQVAQERAKAADHHRRAASVRGSSTMAPERVVRALLDVAMDHGEGYAAPWVTLRERRTRRDLQSLQRAGGATP